DRSPIHRPERSSPVKNRMRETRTSGSVRGGDSNVLTYSAECQRHRPIRPVAGQALEPGIAVHLQHAREPGEMPRRAIGLAVLGVDVGRHRMAWALPGPIVHRITPELPGLGPPASGL